MKQPIDIEWIDGDTSFKFNNVETLCVRSNDVCRALARAADENALYGALPHEKTEIDHWLTFSIGQLCNKNEFFAAVQYLDKVLSPVTYLVAKRVTIADFAVFASLYGQLNNDNYEL